MDKACVIKPGIAGNAPVNAAKTQVRTVFNIMRPGKKILHRKGDCSVFLHGGGGERHFRQVINRGDGDCHTTLHRRAHAITDHIGKRCRAIVVCIRNKGVDAVILAEHPALYLCYLLNA